MYDITLIGYGIAHISLLLTLQKWQLRIAVVDPYFDGGDLRRVWATIKSNTTWQQFLNAVEPYVSSVRYGQLMNLYDPNKVVELGALTREFVSITETIKVSKYNGLVSRVDYKEATYTLTLTDGRKIVSKAISYAPGAEPKTLTYPKPTLTLQNVLCPTHLSLTVKRGDRVVLFGLAHSGTLALDALHKVGATITAIYHTETPFQYARDGFYSGIKQESATIADNVAAGAYDVRLLAATNGSAVTQALLEADWVIYATGFAGRNAVQFYMNDMRADATSYDAATGRLLEVGPAAFGFGIAYPNSNIVDGSLYYDVSLAAFLEHCEKNAAHIVNCCMG